MREEDTEEEEEGEGGEGKKKMGEKGKENNELKRKMLIEEKFMRVCGSTCVPNQS